MKTNDISTIIVSYKIHIPSYFDSLKIAIHAIEEHIHSNIETKKIFHSHPKQTEKYIIYRECISFLYTTS